MSYCVHCGVKLGEGEKRCPLCKTAVYDPAEPAPAFQPRAYPVRTPEQEIKIKTGLGQAICLVPGKSEQYLLLEFEDQ